MVGLGYHGMPVMIHYRATIIQGLLLKFMAGFNTTAKLCCGGLLHGPGDDPAPVVIFDHHHLDVWVVVAPVELYKGCEVNNDYCTSLGELKCLQTQRQDSVGKEGS